MKKIKFASALFIIAIAAILLTSIDPDVAEADYYTTQDALNFILQNADSLPGMSDDLGSLVTLLTALGSTSLDSLVDLMTAEGISLDSAITLMIAFQAGIDSSLFWADSLDARCVERNNYLYAIANWGDSADTQLDNLLTWQDSLAFWGDSLDTRQATIATWLESIDGWVDSADARYGAFITWYDSIITVALERNALLIAANAWHDSTAYSQDAILTVNTDIASIAASIDSHADSIVKTTTEIADTTSAISATNRDIETGVDALVIDAAAIEVDADAIVTSADSIAKSNTAIYDSIKVIPAINRDIKSNLDDIVVDVDVLNDILTAMDPDWTREIVYAGHDVTTADTTFFTTGWGVADGGKISLQIYASGIVGDGGEPLIIAKMIEEGHWFPLYMSTNNLDPTDTLVIADGTNYYTTWLVGGYNATFKFALDRYLVFGDSIGIILLPDDVTSGTIFATGRYKKD